MPGSIGVGVLALIVLIYMGFQIGWLRMLVIAIAGTLVGVISTITNTLGQVLGALNGVLSNIASIG